MDYWIGGELLLLLLVIYCVYYQVDSQQTLRDLRLQFAEQISLLATERKNSHVIETLFRGKKGEKKQYPPTYIYNICRLNHWCNTSPKCVCRCVFAFPLLLDNRIESLIQKADQVLNSLSRRSGGENCPVDSAETRTQPRTQGFFFILSSIIHRSYHVQGHGMLLRGEVNPCQVTNSPQSSRIEINNTTHPTYPNSLQIYLRLNWCIHCSFSYTQWHKINEQR